jgi:hypothetical protein
MGTREHGTREHGNMGLLLGLTPLLPLPRSPLLNMLWDLRLPLLLSALLSGLLQLLYVYVYVLGMCMC